MCRHDNNLLVIDDTVATDVIRFLVHAWPESILIAFESNKIQGHPLPLDLIYQRSLFSMWLAYLT